MYFKPPLGICERRQQRNTKNTKQRLQEVVGGGIAAGVASGHLPSLTNMSSFLSTMRGE
jgi:hypothetical protein